ncbi:glucose-6-phosphate/phosphate translocator 1 [Hibiscus syriacus]|uniref:Glucose-6-phosphate/phosphate translocator 1 n=1 Tax=Hibiscus syriacus TaxID=106335 RepID=A0A6A2ZYR3_HIBSY|nr:glucose-6-phosphate/phosphate translocator 1 [Hibiscus syriacus]
MSQMTSFVSNDTRKPDSLSTASTMKAGCFVWEIWSLLGALVIFLKVYPSFKSYVPFQVNHLVDLIKVLWHLKVVPKLTPPFNLKQTHLTRELEAPPPLELLGLAAPPPFELQQEEEGGWFDVPRGCNFDVKFNPTKSNPRLGLKSSEIRCCKNQKIGEKSKSKSEKNYYELFGIPFDFNKQQIKEAYRKLQKKHGYTLMLNEAYNVLIQDDLRKKFDTSIGSMKAKFGCSASGFSSWHGPVRPQTLFVDANACIGCRECVHHASNTFEMDEALRCARVKVQYRDSDRKIDVKEIRPLMPFRIKVFVHMISLNCLFCRFRSNRAG